MYSKHSSGKRRLVYQLGQTFNWYGLCTAAGWPSMLAAMLQHNC
jgi:hypothetical protein